MQLPEMTTGRLVLAVLVGGPFLGLAMGIAANPTMSAPPEPSWRSARPDPIFRESQRLVDAGPQDLSPAWYVDRMPTWKRREAEAEARRQAAFYVPTYAEEPTAPEPAMAERVVEVASVPEEPRSADAAARLAPDRDAAAGPAAEAAAAPQDVITLEPAEAGGQG